MIPNAVTSSFVIITFPTLSFLIPSRHTGTAVHWNAWILLLAGTGIQHEPPQQVQQIFFTILVRQDVECLFKKSSSANMKNACIDEGDVDGGDNIKVEYDGV